MISSAIRYGTCLVLCGGLASATSGSASSCAGPAEMEKNLQAHPTAETYADRGEWFGKQKQYECAVEAYTSALKIEPGSAQIAFMLGVSLYSAGEIKASIAPLLLAEQRSVGNTNLHLVLAAAYDQLHQSKDAETEWRAALAITPESTDALDNLSTDLIADKDYAGTIALLENPLISGQRTPAQSLNLGLAYSRTGRVQESITILREGLNTSPDSIRLGNELALSLMLLNRSEEATAVLDLATESHPEDLETRLLYLRALMSTQSTKASEVGHGLLLTSPHNWEVLYLNGVLEAKDGKLPEARAHLEQASASNPEAAMPHDALGLVLAQLKDMAGARRELEKAIALGDDDPDVEGNLAKVLMKLGDAGQAQEKQRRAQELQQAQQDKTQAAVKSNAGDRELASGKAAEAVALFKEAIKSDPDDALLSYKLAMALDKTNDPVAEMAALRRALQLNPNLSEAQNQMGSRFIRSGNPVEAERYFRAAIHAAPSSVVAWVNLASALVSEAKLQDAKDALGQALAIDPDNEAARQLGQAIAAQQSKR